jgi:hypothetical protein
MPSFFRGNHTETAGTVIKEVIPSYRNTIIRLDSLRYENSINDHTLTFMRPVGTTRTTKAAAAGDTRFTLDSLTPSGLELLTTADWLIWRDVDGKCHADLITSIVGSAAVLTDVLPTAIGKGATIWALYEVGRSNHTQVTLPASEIVTFVNFGITAGYDEPGSRIGSGDPVMIHIDNAATAGTLRYLGGRYLPKAKGLNRATEVVSDDDLDLEVIDVPAPPPPL